MKPAPRFDSPLLRALENKIPPVVAVALYACAMWLPTLYRSPAAFEPVWRTPVAIAVAALGALVTLAGARAFRSAGTSVDPTRPDKASSIVASGIYRYSRNPMYLGMLLVLAGWAIHLSSSLSFALLLTFVPYMNRFQIVPEERALNEKFGEQFAAYRDKVRRWI